MEVFLSRCGLRGQHSGFSPECQTRRSGSSERFLCKTLNASDTGTARVINFDKNAAYLPAVDAFKADEQLPKATELRQVKYLNNRVEQDHRFIKRLTKPGMGLPFVQHGTTDLERHRGNEHDSQRPGSRR